MGHCISAVITLSINTRCGFSPPLLSRHVIILVFEVEVDSLRLPQIRIAPATR